MCFRCRLAIKKKDKLKRSDSSDESEDADENAVGVCWQKIHVGCKYQLHHINTIKNA